MDPDAARSGCTCGGPQALTVTGSRRPWAKTVGTLGPRLDGRLSRGADRGCGPGTDGSRSDPDRDQCGLPSPVARGRPPGPGGRGGRLAHPAWGAGAQPRQSIEAPRAVEGGPCRSGVAVRTGRATGPRLDLRLARPRAPTAASCRPAPARGRPRRSADRPPARDHGEWAERVPPGCTAPLTQAISLDNTRNDRTPLVFLGAT